MKKRKEPYNFLVLVMILLLMSACSSPVIGTGGSALTALEVLQNSSVTMKQLKSVHFDLSVASIVQTSDENYCYARPPSHFAPFRLW